MAIATKPKICYVIDTKQKATAHKGLTNKKSSNATHHPAKVQGWLLLCMAIYKM
jgi:hypothetical protein